MSYINSIKPIIKEWVANTIKADPRKYGVRSGNSAIMKAYLAQIHEGTKTEDLHPEAMTAVSAVSRARNLFLKANPQYDLRGRK